MGTQTKLRILHVTEAFGSGVFEAVRLIANAGAAEGHTVHVAHGLRPSTPQRFSELFDGRVSLHPLRWGPTRSVLRLVQGTIDLWRILRAEPWDVVHFHSTFAGVAGALTTKRNATTVYTPHGYAFLMQTLSTPARICVRAVEFGVARRMTVIGAVSSDEASEARRIGAKAVETIYNGIAELNPDRLQGISAQTTPRRGVVAAGRMSAQRQPEAVARIFRGLEGAADTSWIGDADDAVAQPLRDVGTAVTGWLPRAEVLERLRRARIYLHWTAWDGHPLSVLEAISQGAVVVAHDIPPVREVLGSDQLCGSEAEAVARIRVLLEDDDMLTEFRLAQSSGAERFSGATMSASWQALYLRLAQSPRNAKDVV